jgi:tetratricopeptide (TPR) repeat protein
MMRRADRVALGAAFAVAALLTACAPRDESTCPPCACAPGERPVVDAKLLAFLSKARAAHHRADLALGSSDHAGAVKTLAELTEGAAPVQQAPEAREVLADTRARLADLRSASGEFDAAERDIEAGLALAKETTHFRGHLFEVRGLLEQRRAKALVDSGDVAGAERARQRAMAAFQAAIDNQDEVIRRELGEDAAR